ncbi:MAG TPA: poly(3-hydroxybutyrate) depolymerase-like protein, partial [Rhodobacterales bacterium]|nr:poly(3-hydroxybutyrate) depolymerase-like protein [Rhodobacterales bacterium]
MPLLRFTLLIVAAVSLAAPALADTTQVTFEQDGLNRTFLLTVPDGLDGPAPLVLALHGVLETDESMHERVTRTRLDVLAERFGFVVAYPSAWGRVWNLSEGEGARQLLPKRADIAFL